MKKLPVEFKRLSQIENDFKRRLYFAGVLTKYLSKKKIRPVVVGGHAVEFYTLGSYTTGDIDRLNAYVWWKSESDGEWAERILKIKFPEIDMGYLRKMAKREKIEKVLEEILSKNEKD
jgi:hypothetical protein